MPLPQALVLHYKYKALGLVAIPLKMAWEMISTAMSCSNAILQLYIIPEDPIGLGDTILFIFTI